MLNEILRILNGDLGVILILTYPERDEVSKKYVKSKKVLHYYIQYENISVRNVKADGLILKRRPFKTVFWHILNTGEK